MVLFFIGLLIIAADQIIKYSLILHLKFGETIAGSLFDITLVKNTGTAFGLFTNQNVLFVILGIIFVILLSIFFFKFKKKEFLFKFCFIFILSGALSNLFDRLRLGYVVDYIDLRFWPVFNIADSAITVGAATLVILILIKKD